MFEERYEQAMENVHPGDELIARTAEKCAQRTRRTALLPRGFRLAAALAMMLLAVVALGRFAMPPTDVTTGDKDVLQNDFVPLSQPNPASGYSLTADEPYINEKGELCIPLTVTGEGINYWTDINFERQPAEVTRFFTDTGTSYLRDEEKDYSLDPSMTSVLRFKLITRYTYEDLGGSMTFSTKKISLCNENFSLRQSASVIADWPVTKLQTQKVYCHRSPREYFTEEYIAELESEGIDYRDLDHRTERELLPPGEVLLDMGNGVGITAVGYHPVGWLIVQVRQPTSALSSSYHTVFLDPLSPDPDRQLAGREEYWWDDAGEYRYTEYMFYHADATNLDEFTLVTAARHAYKEITEPLTVTVDLTNLQIPE